MKKLYAALFILILSLGLASCKAELTSIEVNADSVHKTEYYMSDAFSSEGLYIDAVYSKGSKQILDATDTNITITGFNSSWPAAAQKINISYKGKTEIFKTSYDVSIKAKTNAGYSAHYDNNVLFQYPSGWTKTTQALGELDLMLFTDNVGIAAGYNMMPFAVPVAILPQSTIETLLAEYMGGITFTTFETVTFAKQAGALHMGYSTTEIIPGVEVHMDIYMITHDSSTYLFIFASETGNVSAAAAFTALEESIIFRT